MKILLLSLSVFLFTANFVFAQNEVKPNNVQKDSEKQAEASKQLTSDKIKSIDDLKAQIKKLKNKRGFKVEYDRFEDNTIVSSEEVNLIGYNEAFGKMMSGSLASGKSVDPPSLYMNTFFVFDSDKLNKDVDTFYLAFKSSNQEWQYLRNRDLYAIADNERLVLGTAKFSDNKIKLDRISGVSVQELITFVVTRDQLRKLAEAKSTEIRVGEREQKLKDKHKQMFRNLLALGAVSETQAISEK